MALQWVDVPWGERPWTWEEIAALRGKARAQFLEAYGARGKAALVAADHPPGTHTHLPACGTAGPGKLWECDGCPLDCRSTWRGGQWGACTEVAMATYARMVAKLGLLPREGGEGR